MRTLTKEEVAKQKEKEKKLRIASTIISFISLTISLIALTNLTDCF